LVDGFRRDAENGNRDIALPVAERRGDNSPAFQCRVQSTKVASPGGTTGMFKMMTPEIMCHPFSRPCGTRAGDGRYPALKRRAIAGLSLWDGKQFDCLALADVWFILAKLFWQAQSRNCETENFKFETLGRYSHLCLINTNVR